MDGAANVVDAMLITQYEAGLIRSGTCRLCLAKTDMNCDGRIDVVDALIITQCEVGIINPFCPN